MTDTIPERRRTLVGSPPRRQQLEGREAVERALRFCRSHPWRWAGPQGQAFNRACSAQQRPARGPDDVRVEDGRQLWLGPAAGLNLDQLEALLRGGFAIHADQLFQLVGDKLLITPIEEARRLGWRAEPAWQNIPQEPAD